MPQPDPGTELDQVVRGDDGRGADRVPQPCGRTPDQRRVTERLCGCQQQQLASLRGQRLQPSEEAVLDAPTERLCGGRPETAR